MPQTSSSQEVSLNCLRWANARVGPECRCDERIPGESKAVCFGWSWGSRRAITRATETSFFRTIAITQSSRWYHAWACYRASTVGRGPKPIIRGKGRKCVPGHFCYVYSTDVAWTGLNFDEEEPETRGDDQHATHQVHVEGPSHCGVNVELCFFFRHEEHARRSDSAQNCCTNKMTSRQMTIL